MVVDGLGFEQQPAESPAHEKLLFRRVMFQIAEGLNYREPQRPWKTSINRFPARKRKAFHRDATYAVLRVRALQRESLQAVTLPLSVFIVCFKWWHFGAAVYEQNLNIKTSQEREHKCHSPADKRIAKNRCCFSELPAHEWNVNTRPLVLASVWQSCEAAAGDDPHTTLQMCHDHFCFQRTFSYLAWESNGGRKTFLLSLVQIFSSFLSFSRVAAKFTVVKCICVTCA